MQDKVKTSLLAIATLAIVATTAARQGTGPDRRTTAEDTAFATMARRARPEIAASPDKLRSDPAPYESFVTHRFDRAPVTDRYAVPSFAADSPMNARAAVVSNPIVGHVPDPTAYPFRTICFVVSRFPDGSTKGGTGFMIGDHFLLTAAHNIFSSSLKGWATSIAVAPAYTGGPPFTYGTTTVVASRLSTVWVTTEAPGDDYGVVALKANIGLKTGTMDFGSVSPLYNGMRAATVGYPAFDFGKQWYFNDGIRYYDDVIVQTLFKTDRGMSGSPLFTTGGRPRAFGVLCAGGNMSTTFARINPFREDLIRDFMRKFR